MGNIKDGTFLGKIIGKAEMKTGKTELHGRLPAANLMARTTDMATVPEKGAGSRVSGRPLGTLAGCRKWPCGESTGVKS